MSGNPFYLLDVFAESKYSGNQLAVIRVRNPLSDNDMQRIAREINFSETTFTLSETPRDGGYDVRIFTPGEEVPFAGHPTLLYLRADETDGKIHISVGGKSVMIAKGDFA